VGSLPEPSSLLLLRASKVLFASSRFGHLPQYETFATIGQGVAWQTLALPTGISQLSSGFQLNPSKSHLWSLAREVTPKSPTCSPSQVTPDHPPAPAGRLPPPACLPLALGHDRSFALSEAAWAVELLADSLLSTLQSQRGHASLEVCTACIADGGASG